MTTPETTPAQRIPDADGSAYPWWAIIDPHGVTARLLSRDRAPSAVAFAVHGPFLSRAAAQAEVDGAPHRYSPGTQVWCLSGHRSPDWRALCAEPPDAAARLAAAEAEIQGLRRQCDRLTASINDLLGRLQEAHTDANALAAAVLIAQGMHDDAEQLGLHATGEQVDGAIGRAVWRLGGAQ